MRFRVERKISLCSVETRAPAHRIDGLEACRGNQPGTRLVRNTSLRPGLQSGSECLMHGLFGEIQISEEAHERRQNPARLRSVKSLNGPAELFGHRRRHLRQTSKRSGSTQLRSGFHLPIIRWPATALIEGLQRDNSIGPRKRVYRHQLPNCRQRGSNPSSKPVFMSTMLVCARPAFADELLLKLLISRFVEPVTEHWEGECQTSSRRIIRQSDNWARPKGKRSAFAGNFAPPDIIRLSCGQYASSSAVPLFWPEPPAVPLPRARPTPPTRFW